MMSRQNKKSAGLSNLSGKTFTIINQIPESPSVNTKVAWIKHTLTDCGKKDGLFDQSSGTMSSKANTWTAYLNDWERYKPPHWLDGGYYALPDDAKPSYFTVNVGDLIIFDDIPDVAPTTLTEFNALSKKYKDIGGAVTSAEAYITYKPNGEPWGNNHIEAIKG